MIEDNVIRLLPAGEEAILACYVTGSKERASFQRLYDAIEVPAADETDGISRLEIAVAQILLHHVQDELPQWAAVKDGELLLNRRRHQRHKGGLLPFHIHNVFSRSTGQRAVPAMTGPRSIGSRICLGLTNTSSR